MAERTLVRRIFAIFDRASAKKSEQEFKDSLAKAGAEGGKAFLRELRAAFDKRMAELKTSLAAGLIDQKEFKKQSELAAKTFNDALLKSMEKARLEGNLTEKEYIKLSRTLKRVGDEGATAWGRIKNGISEAGIALAAFLSLRTVGRFLGGSIKEFESFDLAMTQSLAIMGDVSDAMRERMVKAARQMSVELNLSAADVARSFYFLASAGLTAEESLKALPIVARFAKAGAFDLARATDLLADAQSALGLRIRTDVIKNMENMARVSDVLTEAGNVSNATVQQFSEAITNKAGPALRQTNKDIEEGAAVLAVFADQGIKGSEAGEQLAIVLRDLQRANRENRKDFERLGITVFDSAGEVRNMADIVGQLERVLGPMSSEMRGATLAQLGFADRSVAALKALIGTSDAIRTYEAGLRQAAGTTQEVVDKQMKAFAERWGQIKREVEEAKIELGQTVLESLNLERNLPRLTRLLQGAVQQIGNLVSLLGSLAKALVIVGGVRGFLALRAGLLAAESAIALFRVGVQRLFVAIGPTGWAIIGLTTLIELFTRLGGSAKVAAEEQRKAIDALGEWAGRDERTAKELQVALDGMVAEEKRIKERLNDLKKETRGAFIGQASERMGRRPKGPTLKEQIARQREINELSASLNGLLAREKVVREALAKVPPPKAPGGEDGDGTGLLGGGPDPKKLAAELEKVLTDTAVARLQIEKGLTEGQAREQVRREQLLAGHVERTKASVAELTAAYAELARAQGIVGVLAPTETQRTGQLGRGTESTAPGLLPIPAGGLPDTPDQKAPAKEFFDPWFEAMHLLRDEVEGEGSLFAELGQAWAEGGLAGFARLAAAKVKENIARAIEEAAKAFGSFALGNPAAATAHAKAAAGHAAAATAWKVAGGAAGGGGSTGNGGGIAAGAGPGSDRASRIDTRAEVHVHIPERVAALVDDKDFQSMVYVGQERFRERVGNNVKVIVHRGSR